MKQSRFTIFLEAQLSKALLSMSREDYRTPTQEALWLLREEAERRGLLAVKTNAVSPSSVITPNDDSKQEGSHVTD